jgi:hypothetical protein
MRFLFSGLLLFTLGCSQQSMPATKVAVATPTVAQTKLKLTPASIKGPPSAAWSEREVEVLELLFFDRFKDIQKTEEAQLVIHADTAVTAFDDYVPDPTEDAGTIEAWEDFQRNNQKPVPLPSTLARKLPVRLLTANEYTAMWQSNNKYCGWMRYQAMFPNSVGLYTLSRVGFSQDGKTAVVSMVDLMNEDCVSLGLVVFKKEQGLWRKPRNLYSLQS